MKTRILVEIDPDNEDFHDNMQLVEDMSRATKVKAAVFEAWNDCRQIWKHGGGALSNQIDDMYTIVMRLNEYVNGDGE